MSEESMTRDPVELTRSSFACAEAADIHGIMSFVGPDSVWDITAWSFGTYEGPRAIRRFLNDWIGSFAEYRREPEEILDLGGGVVFAVGVTRGRPAGRRDEIRLRGAAVYTWEEEVAKQVTFYRDPDEARAAAERLAQERG
jgi:ketosteroid isomerase-like protein